MRLSARSDPKPKFGGPAQPPPHSGGRLPGRVCPVGPLSIVPRILAGGCLAPPSGRRRDGKVQSARWASRKGAFWTGDVTEKRISPYCSRTICPWRRRQRWLPRLWVPACRCSPVGKRPRFDPQPHVRVYRCAGPHARRVLWVLCTLCHLCVLCTLCLRPERHTAFRLGDGEVMCRAVSEPV